MAKQISLSRGLFAIVDDEDYEWLNQWKWYANIDTRNGRAVATRAVYDVQTKKQTRLMMHNLIMNPPAGMEVDHINHNSLDNRRANLRLATRASNLRNRKTFRSNKSGFKGVTFNPVNGRWRATINLGTYDSAEEAARAYDQAIRVLFGELAKPNFDE